jgi:hypothetical protein
MRETINAYRILVRNPVGRRKKVENIINMNITDVSFENAR